MWWQHDNGHVTDQPSLEFKGDSDMKEKIELTESVLRDVHQSREVSRAQRLA